MKIITRKTKTGASISIRATTQQDKDFLTEAVMSGRLMKALNEQGLKPSDVTIRPTRKGNR